MAVRVGTSGFLYKHWRGRFYPPSARGAELEHYAQHFDTVELNVTFYRMPARATFRSWAARVPPGFLFAVKSSRYLTHVLRLRDPRDAVARLMERSSELETHLGPILVQLPPDMSVDLARLEATLEAFPSEVRVAVEPRHPSWFTDELRTMLTSRNVALCLADRRGPISPTWRTADWTYLRFHGGRAKPGSCYGERAIVGLTRRFAQIGPVSEAFAFFNNDHAGCALRDAARFGRQLQTEGFGVSHAPDVDDDIVA